VATINGVLGPIETEDLGFTLMHEHILVANRVMRHCFSGYVDEDELIRMMTIDNPRRIFEQQGAY
jgi:predicted metal-dependent phosphotriesterase family hydrolase